jgi:transcriptional regulator with XRE-family HTH domain
MMSKKNVSAQLSLGKIIRNRRIELGWSQESFALKVGLHRTYVGSIERGERNVSLENLCLISKRLGTSVSDLMKEASL